MSGAFPHVVSWIVGTGAEWVSARDPIIMGPARHEASHMLLLEAGMVADYLAAHGTPVFIAPCCVKVDCQADGCGHVCGAGY